MRLDLTEARVQVSCIREGQGRGGWGGGRGRKKDGRMRTPSPNKNQQNQKNRPQHSQTQIVKQEGMVGGRRRFVSFGSLKEGMQDQKRSFRVPKSTVGGGALDPPSPVGSNPWTHFS